MLCAQTENTFFPGGKIYSAAPAGGGLTLFYMDGVRDSNRFAWLANFNAHCQILVWRWTRQRHWVPTRNNYCMPLWAATIGCTILDPPVIAGCLLELSSHLCILGRPYSCSLSVPCYVDGGWRRKCLQWLPTWTSQPFSFLLKLGFHQLCGSISSVSGYRFISVGETETLLKHVTPR